MPSGPVMSGVYLEFRWFGVCGSEGPRAPGFEEEIGVGIETVRISRVSRTQSMSQARWRVAVVVWLSCKHRWVGGYRVACKQGEAEWQGMRGALYSSEEKRADRMCKKCECALLGVEWSGVERATVWTINRYLS